MAREKFMLIDTNTGAGLNGPREFDLPDDEANMSNVAPGTDWVPYQTTARPTPRRGETVVRAQWSEPLPYQSLAKETPTIFYDGWRIEGEYIPPTPEEEMALALSNARRTLTDYLYRYQESQFVVDSRTYSANTRATNRYQSINTFIREEITETGAAPTDNLTRPYTVADILGEPLRITTFQQWLGFWASYRTLFGEAETKAFGYWEQILNANTAEEVNNLMASFDLSVPGDETAPTRI